MQTEIYQQLWQEFVMALDRNQLEADPFLCGKPDDRRGITALAFLQKNSPAVCNHVSSFQQKLRLLEPEQYFQPAETIHLTLLSIISCIAGFTLEEVEAESYIRVFRQVMSAWCEQRPGNNGSELILQLRGVTASQSCILLQGFMLGDGLNILRDQLRAAFSASGLKHSIDSRYTQRGAHLTLCRFKAPLRQPTALLTLCQQYREYDFGTFPIKVIELVFNNWYLDQQITRSLAVVAIHHNSDQ